MIQPPTQQPTANSLPVLKEIKCPNCGSSVLQYSPGSQTLVCQKCNSYVTIGMDAPTIVGKSRALPPPPAPIKLGHRFSLNNAKYFVLGRALYEGWDFEDSSDRWRWTEWLLGSDDGRLIWLAHDKEDGFVLFNKMRIREAFNPQSDSTIPIGDGKKAYVRERYPAQIIGAEGELTWRAKENDRLLMIEGAGNGKHYSIQHTSEELEVYEGTPVPEMAVAGALNDQTWAQTIKRRDEMRGLWATIGVMALIFGVIALVMGAMASRTGEQLVSKDVKLSAATPTVIIPVNFDIPDRPAVIRMWLINNIPANTFYDIDVSIISPDESETFIFDQEFWHETGSDEDGFWSEKSSYGEDKFVPHQVGAHSIELLRGETTVTNEVTIRVAVFKNHIVPTWLFGYGALTALIGFLLLAANRGGKTIWIAVLVIVVAIGIVILNVLGVDLLSIVGDLFSEM
jgi:hypothetical protein